MATGQSPKVRLVKCPKCRELLPENEDVPVYQCGGCLTILQAKKRNNTVSMEEKQLSERQGFSSSRPSMELSSDQVENDPNRSADSVAEKFAGVKLSKDEHMNQIQEIDGDEGENSKPEVSYEYIGSVTSSDAREHRLPSRAGVSSDERLRKGKFIMQGRSESSNNERNTLLPETKHSGIRHSMRDEWSDRKWRAHEAFYRKGPSFSGPYHHGSTSHHSHDHFDSRSHAYSQQMPRYVPSHLQWKDAHIHPYMYHHRDSNYARESLLNQRHHAGPTGWQSSQLRDSYSSYPGSPQSQTEHEYYLRWSRESIVSDVEDHHRHRRGGGQSHGVRTYPRKTQTMAAKHHICPIAGGAPFTSCYYCAETLQLPVDFLVFKNKYHFLRCGNCMNTLRFTLRDKTHLVPTITNELSERTVVNSAAENEELPVARGSPLHQLMGYSSISQVFKASKRPPSLRMSDYYQKSKN